jgi:hypothetical protein
MSSARLNDTIGATYTATRRTEPRIAAQVWAALGDARTDCYGPDFVPTLSQQLGPGASRTVPASLMSVVRSHRDQDRLRLGGSVGTQQESPDLPDNAEVAGSIPASPTNIAAGHCLFLLVTERHHTALRPRGGRGTCLFRHDGRHKCQLRSPVKPGQSLAQLSVGVGEQMAVAVESERLGGVPSPPRDLQRVAASFDSKRDGGVAQIVGTQRTQIETSP